MTEKPSIAGVENLCENLSALEEFMQKSYQHVNDLESMLTIMLEKEAYSMVADKLKPESFYEQKHQ